MSDDATPAKVRLTDGLGPNALTYARERVSLLGAGEHIDTVNRALDALEGLPGAALLGGWTFKGFTAWAQGLESEIARQRAELARFTPLTRQQIDDVMTQHYPLSSLLREEVDAFEACVRDIERLHGIGA